MRAFISWSGTESRRVGEALRDWLPLVVHGLTCWMSSEDIHAGERWGITVSNELMKSEYGIVILTQENLHAPWILFEAGALAKAVGLTQVCPVLIDVELSDLPGPLCQFQGVNASKRGIWSLVRSLYNANELTTLTEPQQQHIVDGLWPRLAQTLNRKTVSPDAAAGRKEPRITVVEYEEGREIHHHLSFPRSFQDLLDLLYMDAVGDAVPVYSYGETWVLRNVRNNQELRKNANFDSRTLADLNLRDGDQLALVRLRTTDNERVDSTDANTQFAAGHTNS